MKNYVFKNETDGKMYKRITKAQARNAYYDNKIIVLCPCNMRPFGFYGMQCEISQNDDLLYLDIQNDDFKYRVFNYEYYNCNNKETGFYTSFYIAID